jgi:hypothetical protein
MRLINILQLVAMVLLTGCGCKIEHVKQINPIQSRDKLLSCQQIQNEINIAQYHVTANERKKDYAASYAGSPRCLVDALLKIDLAQNAAEERVQYLSTLANNKQCKVTETPS